MQNLVIFVAQYLIILMYVGAVVFYFLQPLLIRKHILIYSVIALPLGYILAKLAGLVYNNPRPFVVDGATPMFAHLPDNGFPSGHTFFSGILAVILYRFNKKLGISFFALSVLIGLARVLAHVHHVIDVIGSLIIVIITGFIVNFIVSHIHKSKITNLKL